MTEGPVEQFLDELLAFLIVDTGGDLRHARRLVAEAEAHLWDATAEGMAAGLTEVEAETEAVARFGPVAALHRPHPTSSLAARVLSSGWRLGALAAIAVGVSGVLALVLRAAGGPLFLAGRPAASALDAVDCARWMAGTHAASCAQAATADWAHDTVLFRVAFGVLGLLALGAFRLWRRRFAVPAGLPSVVADTVAVTAFGAAGLWLVGQTVDRLVVASGDGAGQWLAAAPVALTMAAVFGLRLLREVRAVPT